ncbi:MAG TPA: hypothetical protein VLR50_13060, partial [Desulfobacterales bacterium]|nr:hypothetical protein [Desulfobacterales bacterium]
QGVEKQASGRPPSGYSLEARGLRLEAQNKFRSNPPGFQLRASSFQPIACEHLQNPHNTGSRP